MKTCFISMPFGIKSDPSGTRIDFDRLYMEVLKPGVEALGLTCLRADELVTGTLIHKDIFSSVLSSDARRGDM